VRETNKRRRCRIITFGDAPAEQDSTYLVTVRYSEKYSSDKCDAWSGLGLGIRLRLELELGSDSHLKEKGREEHLL